MKLSLLIKREPFVENFIKTIKNYLFLKFNWDGEVIWKSGNNFISREGDWAVNLRLNIIYCSDINSRLLFGVTKEYIYHPKFFRNLFQLFYVKLSTYKFTRMLFNNAIINFSEDPVFLNESCIIGGNRTLRILNFRLGKCVVIHKYGFPISFFCNQIFIREEYKFLSIPRLIDYSIEHGWLEEELIYGLPLNRINEVNLYLSIRECAFEELFKLYQNSLEVIDIDIWFVEKVNIIKEAIDNLPNVFEIKDIKRINLFLDRLISLYKKEVSSKEKFILSCTTHGDLQDANILSVGLDNSKYYMIDWEFSQKRFCYYDALVYFLKSRQPIGLSKRINKLLSNIELQKESISWCYLPDESSYKSILIKYLFEELHFRIQDSTIPELYNKHGGMLTFVDEMEMVIL